MSKPLPILTINGREEVVAIERTPEPIRITSREIGTLLANAFGNDQAEILFQWAEAIDRWPLEAAMTGTPPGAWAFQCRDIAEALPDAQCRRISIMLETLIDHLNAVPQERAVAATTNQICDSVAELLS